MASITFECPHCAERITRGESVRGQALLCPSCKGEMRVPPLPDSTQPRLARILDDGSGLPPFDRQEENVVLDVRPAVRAFTGRIVVGAALVLGATAIVTPGTLAGSVETLNPAVQGLACAMAAAGLLLVVSPWVRVFSRRYRITDQRLFVTTGLIARKTDELELFRIKDVKLDQGFFERLLRFGTITVLSTDDTTPEVRLAGIANPEETKERLRTLYRAARKREGLRPMEIIES